MSRTLDCPECGVPLAPDAPGGLCPRCLMDAAYPETKAHSPVRKAPGITPPPAPMIDSAAFRQALMDLGLVDAEGLERLDAGSGAGDASRMARVLMRAGTITPYQAGAILQGKARGLAIGDYLVLDKIGVGGMGVVFKARDRRDGRVVALKILPPSFGRDHDAVRRFRREFQIAAHLSHPNLVAAIEASEDRGVQFLTMEYVPGRNLEELVAEGGSLPIKLALHCVIQAARGLEAAHAGRVIHRDVKPGNIMLDDTGNVRVLDLGLARVIEATTAFGRSMSGSLTQTGAYMGTVDFLAPEQADDAKRADHRSDIYSLGCTLYFLLIGRPPFPGDTLLKRLMAHQERPAPSLQAARPEVSDALESIYRTMMAKRPIDRPQSMTEVVEALEACRTSSREAGDASADLKSFARTVMKRAAPRGHARDTSVFARTPAPSGLRFDPDLRLEDLVGDFREEIGREEIPEEKLPPRPLRVTTARPRRRRSPRKPRPLLGLGVAITFGIVALSMIPRDRPRPTTDGELPRVAQVDPRVDPPVTLEDPKRISDPLGGFRPLFVGDDLTACRTFGGPLERWELKDGVLSSRPHNEGAAFVVTREAFDDFLLRLEFQTSGPVNGGLMLMTDGAAPDDPNCVELVDIGRSRTGNTWRWGDGGSFRMVEVPQVEYRDAGEWNTIDVERRDGRIHVEVNGQTTHEGLTGVEGPRWIGFQNYPGAGVVRYRNMRIREFEPSSPSTTPFGKLLYAESFNDSASGWANESADQRARRTGEHHGYSDGLYRLVAHDPGWWFWSCPWKPTAEFAWEVDCRVYGDQAEARGEGIVLLDYEPGSFQVKIHWSGAVSVLITSKAGHAANTIQGPFPLPGIKTGRNEWNRVKLLVSRGQARVSINEVSIGEPIDLPADSAPRWIALGIACNAPTLHAEFDRVEIRERIDP